MPEDEGESELFQVRHIQEFWVGSGDGNQAS